MVMVVKAVMIMKALAMRALVKSAAAKCLRESVRRRESRHHFERPQHHSGKPPPSIAVSQDEPASQGTLQDPRSS